MFFHIVSISVRSKLITLQNFEIFRNEHSSEISAPDLEGWARAHAPNILQVFEECLEALRFNFLCCYDKKQQI